MSTGITHRPLVPLGALAAVVFALAPSPLILSGAAGWSGGAL